MSGIYIHIPFCKQACHYCDFHFSTSTKKKSELVEMLCKELKLRKDEIGQTIQTIYFGGGTPSLPQPSLPLLPPQPPPASALHCSPRREGSCTSTGHVFRSGTKPRLCSASEMRGLSITQVHGVTRSLRHNSSHVDNSSFDKPLPRECSAICTPRSARLPRSSILANK